MGVVASLLAAASVALPAPGACLAARGPLAAETIANSADFTPVACPPGKLDHVFFYDHVHGATRLARAVAASETVPMFPEFGGHMVHPGDTLKLVSAYGQVRIERDVEAMQAALPGQRLFVKSSDGQIVSVRYETGTP